MPVYTSLSLNFLHNTAYGPSTYVMWGCVCMRRTLYVCVLWEGGEHCVCVCVWGGGGGG